MMKSMTAFGRGRLDTEKRSVTVEIKSVNSRFFDCSVKMPRSLSLLEERIKNYIQKNAVSRAKVDVYITVDEHVSEETTVEIDTGVAESYISALRTLRDSFGLADDISVMTVARNSDIFKTKRAETDIEGEWEEIRPVIDSAIDDYASMRTREGERIYADVSSKIELLRGFADEVETISATDTVGYRDKLEARIRAILDDSSVAIDENRLLTECAVWADKIAIDEELVRLRSHFEAFFEISGAPEPAGRKLDFLMQEMNRETNTIGSKANNARIARTVVNMKGELEKIREQIQNVE